MAVLSFLLGVGFAITWRLLDLFQTKFIYGKYGMGEDNDFVRKGSKMVEWKAWLFCFGPIGIAAIPFFFGDESGKFYEFNNVWCGPIAAIGGVASMIAYLSAKRKMKKIRERGYILNNMGQRIPLPPELLK